MQHLKSAQFSHNVQHNAYFLMFRFEFLDVSQMKETKIYGECDGFHKTYNVTCKVGFY